MPTYDYRCKSCGHEFAAFQSITEDALTKCPECGKDTLQRLIGAGAGIIFKGSGFYETDYKRSRSGKGEPKKKESKSSDSPSKDSSAKDSSSSDSKKKKSD